VDVVSLAPRGTAPEPQAFNGMMAMGAEVVTEPHIDDHAEPVSRDNAADDPWDRE
jgi:hypothetical protein